MPQTFPFALLGHQRAPRRSVSRRTRHRKQRCRHVVMIGEPAALDPLDRPIGIAQAQPAGEVHVLGGREPFVEEPQRHIVLGAHEAIDDAPDLIGANHHREAGRLEHRLRRGNRLGLAVGLAHQFDQSATAHRCRSCSAQSRARWSLPRPTPRPYARPGIRCPVRPEPRPCLHPLSAASRDGSSPRHRPRRRRETHRPPETTGSRPAGWIE